MFLHQGKSHIETAAIKNGAFKKISNWFSDAETEIWELENGNNKLIDPVLPTNQYAIGIGLYPVDYSFCQNWLQNK